MNEHHIDQNDQNDGQNLRAKLMGNIEGQNSRAKSMGKINRQIDGHGYCRIPAGLQLILND